ncbi:hypothetical protein ID866_5913 [Astraeus odoratus]|nr:hypothetical protein ID866_5913 [Astraeus odoratus]
MASLTNWLWGTSQIDDAIEKATSELIPSGSEDVALNLEICDQIRSKSAPARDAMRSLKRRLNHKNPNVQLLSLGLADTCVKNGGDHFLSEIASREFMDNLVSILKIPGLNHVVKADILKYIQNWALAFEGKPSLSYVGQVYKTLKSEGFDFPPKDFSHANSAMVDTSTAPEWIDSDVCLRCRTAFTFTNRKHHCRNCGQVFDQQCSSKTLPLPHFGIMQAVRVCDGCHIKLTKKAAERERGHRHSASMYSPRSSSARDLADAELQRAIQLSLEEVGASRHRRPGYTPHQPTWYSAPSEPPIVDHSTRPNRSVPVEEEDDPDLRAAIEASLREANMPKPSAPVDVQPVEDSHSTSYAGLPQSYPPTVTPMPAVSKLTNYDLEPLEADAILTFSQTVEQVEVQGNGDMSRYPAVGELYDKANALRPKLAMSLDDAGRKEQLLSEMHDKLSQAVKLYDKLLTEQISQPWRRAPSAVQRSPESHLTLQRTPTSAPYAPPVSQVPQSPTLPVLASEQQQPQPSYIPFAAAAGPSQQAQSHATSIQAPGPILSSYAYQPQTPTVTAPPPSVQATMLQPNRVSQTETPVTVAPSTFTAPPATLQSTVVQPSPPLAPSSQPDSYSQPQPLPSQALRPPSQVQTQQQSQPSAVIRAQPPPPPPTSPTLTRRSTIGSSHTTNLQSGATVSRSPTVAHVGQYQSARYHPQPQLQQLTRSQPLPQTQAPSLPQFPVAPTSNPQSFDMYAASAPTGLPTTVAVGQERREELLIDL